MQSQSRSVYGIFCITTIASLSAVGYEHNGLNVENPSAYYSTQYHYDGAINEYFDYAISGSDNFGYLGRFMPNELAQNGKFGVRVHLRNPLYGSTAGLCNLYPSQSRTFISAAGRSQALIIEFTNNIGDRWDLSEHGLCSINPT